MNNFNNVLGFITKTILPRGRMKTEAAFNRYLKKFGEKDCVVFDHEAKLFKSVKGWTSVRREAEVRKAKDWMEEYRYKPDNKIDFLIIKTPISGKNC